MERSIDTVLAELKENTRLLDVIGGSMKGCVDEQASLRTINMVLQLSIVHMVEHMKLIEELKTYKYCSSNLPLKYYAKSILDEHLSTYERFVSAQIELDNYVRGGGLNI
jgi:hypothetical protein